MSAQPTTTVLTVACPKCSAAAGSPCVAATGKKSATHADRTKAAVEAAAVKATRTCTGCGVLLTSRNNNPAIVPTHAEHSSSSHAACDHPAAKTARAACRRERAKAAAA